MIADSPSLAPGGNGNGRLALGLSAASSEAQAGVDPNDPSTWGKVARNAPCPCGSGKKFKHCHGQLV